MRESWSPLLTLFLQAFELCFTLPLIQQFFNLFKHLLDLPGGSFIKFLQGKERKKEGKTGIWTCQQPILNTLCKVNNKNASCVNGPLRIQVITHIIAPREHRAAFCRDASSCVTMDTRPRLSCVICGECLTSWSDRWCRGLLRPRKRESVSVIVWLFKRQIGKSEYYATIHMIYSTIKACLFNTYLYRHTLYLSLTCCMRTCPPVDHAGVWKDAQNHHLPPLEEDAGPDSCGTNHDYQNQQREREIMIDQSINQ